MTPHTRRTIVTAARILEDYARELARGSRVPGTRRFDYEPDRLEYQRLRQAARDLRWLVRRLPK